MRDLYAFFGPRLAGVFRDRGAEDATFEYSSNPGTTPLSLSLPLAGPHAGGAAANYLDNLLPDVRQVRERWARDRGLSSSSSFALLAAYGEDVPGALTLTTDPNLPGREPELAIEASEEDIAARISALRREGTSWLDPRVRPRMSLAGAQGKFTLAKVGDRWFWPTFELPSTHILKPPALEHKRIETFESLGLELARTVGLPASESEAREFLGQPTFIVKRWDRAGGVRIHAEDLNQSLANPTDLKYDVTASSVARILAMHGMDREFVRQLAFNVALGNTDAHAKNYSVLLSGGRVQLSPLYDTVPVLLWPRYKGPYSMKVGDAKHPAELTEANWRKFADQSGLDGDQVCQDAFTVMAAVSERYLDHFAAGGADQSRLATIKKHAATVARAIPGDFSAPSLLAPAGTQAAGSGAAGGTWVHEYVREDGTHVRGHHRRPRRS